MMLNNALQPWLLLQGAKERHSAGRSQVSMGKWSLGAVHWEEDAQFPTCSYFSSLNLFMHEFSYP